MRKFGATLAIAPFLALIVAIARLLIISDYQVPTALALASGAGFGATAVGTIIPLAGSLLPIVTLLLALATVLGVLIAAFPFALRVFVASLVCFLATVLVAPTNTPLDVAYDQFLKVGASSLKFIFDALGFSVFPLAVFLLLAYSIVREGQVDAQNSSGEGVLAQQNARVLDRVLATLIVGGVAIYILTSTTVIVYPPPVEVANLPVTLRKMWVPAEVVVLRDGSAQVGYVVTTEGDWTTVLADSPRLINIRKKDDIVRRSVCQVEAESTGIPLISEGRIPPLIPGCAFLLRNTRPVTGPASASPFGSSPVVPQVSAAEGSTPKGR